MRILHATLLWICVASGLAAQDDEARFNKAQADKLDRFARTAFKQGFPRQARLIWMQAIKLYDPNHADARKGLMHVRVGSSWAPDPKATYPIDDTGSGDAAKALFGAYERLKAELAAAHKRQAQVWTKAENPVKARHHWEMVLRWTKDDAEAQQALQHRPVGGVTGTELEKTLFERSKAIEKAVAEQATVDYPVEKVEQTNAVLDLAQVKYVTVQSEHFVLHGDPEEEEHLKAALVWGERTVRVAAVAFPWEAPMGGRFAFFTARDTYKQILRANAQAVQKDLAWMLENTTTSQIGDTVVGATGSVQVLNDAVVRNVAKTHAMFRSDGLAEGIGHTFVGMVFNNNRLFAVDLEKQEGTTASEEDREYTSPNFDVWKTLALEMAWKETGGVPAIDLPYCEAATFSNEQRIKAWSFCDYVMRRDPDLLRTLDQLGAAAQARKQRQPIELADAFAAQSGGVTIAQLDKEWEDFWTEASPVLAAIRNNTPPLLAVSRDVQKWLAAFNEARAANRGTPVTWSSQLSTRCFEHAGYLKANKKERGPAAEHRQLADLGGTHLGNMFAQTAIVETDAKLGDAKKMFARWMSIPGYRDALVHDYLLSVGLYNEGPLLVLNVVAGLGHARSKRSGYLCHPWKDATGIPADAEVAEIGPELEALLAEHERAGQKKVGYPLTMHFGHAVQGDRQSYRCNVADARGRKVEGAILLDSGSNRRSTAPGMVTFYPFEPLPRGRIDVTWSWDADGRAQTLSAAFTTK